MISSRSPTARPSIHIPVRFNARIGFALRDTDFGDLLGAVADLSNFLASGRPSRVLVGRHSARHRTNRTDDQGWDFETAHFDFLSFLVLACLTSSLVV